MSTASTTTYGAFHRDRSGERAAVFVVGPRCRSLRGEGRAVFFVAVDCCSVPPRVTTSAPIT